MSRIKMTLSLKQALFWAPRVVTILFAAFTSLFALDVFDMGYNLAGALLALVVHLLPTWIILLMLAIAWRWELAGGLLFIVFGGLYLYSSWGQTDWTTYFLIPGVPFLAGVLFIVDWRYRKVQSN